MTARVELIGEDVAAIMSVSPDQAQPLAASLRDTGQWREVVAGLDSVAVCFDPLIMPRAAVVETLGQIAQQTFPTLDISADPIVIDVIYGGPDGPDLAHVCQQVGLSEDAVITAHTARPYPVSMMGFTPGFAYVGGLDPDLSVPRLTKPRGRVAAGSVGICGWQTGLYALQGPGGWPIIGRTAKRLFDGASDAPFLLAPGMMVRFNAVLAV